MITTKLDAVGVLCAPKGKNTNMKKIISCCELGMMQVLNRATFDRETNLV